MKLLWFIAACLISQFSGALFNMTGFEVILLTHTQYFVLISALKKDNE